MAPKPIVFRNLYALGDTVCLSAAIRDIERAHPGKFRISLAGHYTSYWKHCPYVHPIDPALKAPVIDVNYKDGAEASHAGRYKFHFLTWFHRTLGKRLGISIPVTAPKGEIFLKPQPPRLIPGRYWVIVAGGKLDMTTKWWHFARYQTVVDQLATHGIRCVQAGANFDKHVHAKLRNCESTIGRTDDIADLFALIKYSEGVICGITSAMHIAAAFDKPCVVIAGGREEPTWEAYTNHGQFPDGCAPVAMPHTFLHTISLLECCQRLGCWRALTVPFKPEHTATVAKRTQLCTDPVRDSAQTIPRCLHMIEPQHVVEAVLQYYKQGSIPPITPHAAPEPAPIVAAVETHQAVPLETRPVGATKREAQAFRILDNPVLGGKVTVFLLCHGNYFDLAHKCFHSITSTVPLERLDLRVALNQPCATTRQYFTDAQEAGLVTAIYPDDGARRKYPAMRQMFHDKDHPITTPYLFWFDDDAQCVDKLWLVRMAEVIIANHKVGGRLFGSKFVHDLTAYAKDGHRPDLWFREATWWRGRELWLRNRAATAANGSVIQFVAGWFWALATEMIPKADIPDRRLGHNGGDITIGESVHQAGGKIVDCNRKKWVWCPTRENGGRRGFSENFPWAPK